jgi:AmiR/NasT family two-component response regulator
MDIGFCLIDHHTGALCGLLGGMARTAIVGIVDPVNPRAMQFLTSIAPQAILTKPLDPAAVLVNMLVAHSNSRYQRRLQCKLSKLEETLRSVRKVERAKSILIKERHIDEAEAYTYLREQAMRKRVPIGVIASLVVESAEILSSNKG